MQKAIERLIHLPIHPPSLCESVHCRSLYTDIDTQIPTYTWAHTLPKDSSMYCSCLIKPSWAKNTIVNIQLEHFSTKLPSLFSIYSACFLIIMVKITEKIMCEKPYQEWQSPLHEAQFGIYFLSLKELKLSHTIFSSSSPHHFAFPASLQIVDKVGKKMLDVRFFSSCEMFDR